MKYNTAFLFLKKGQKSSNCDNFVVYSLRKTGIHVNAQINIFKCARTVIKYDSLSA